MTGLPMAGPGDAPDVDASGGPPAICPSLILPNTEARFMISMEQLVPSSGSMSINILGTSGRKLLHASVDNASDGRRMLAIASVGCEDDPRCLINRPPPESSMPHLEVQGRYGKPYGKLEMLPPNRAILRCGEEPVMAIEVTSPSENRMTANAADGRILATAGPNDGTGMIQSDVPNAWKLQVRPGADAVLISTCMLALALLQPAGLGSPAASHGRTPGASPYGPSPGPSDRALPPGAQYSPAGSSRAPSRR